MNEPLTLTKELEFQLGNIKKAFESYSTIMTKIVVSTIDINNSNEFNLYGFARIKFLTESNTAIRHQKIISWKFRYDKFDDRLYVGNFANYFLKNFNRGEKL